MKLYLVLIPIGTSSLDSYVDESNGPLELTFQDGSLAFFDADVREGFEIGVTSEEWIDPFAPPLSDENIEYIRTHGKWTIFDIRDTVPASLIIGRQITAIYNGYIRL